MRISETPDCLILRDVPMGVWLLGMTFVASGAFVLSVPFWSADWQRFAGWERAAVILIGASHLAGGLYTTLRAAATHTELDRGRGVGRQIVRCPWPPGVKRANFALTDAQAIEIVRSSDSEGDPIFRLRLWLAGSRQLWLAAQPVHGEQRLRQQAEHVRRFLDLPPVTGIRAAGAA